MAVTSGFFNSQNHDRLYNAEQMSSIFDGVINDGVYEFVGDAFEVTPNNEVINSVIVGTGRAWFDHTWTVNDAPFEITLEAPSLVLDRIDAIVIDVDRRDSVRKNSIISVTGTPSNDPQPPVMLNEERHTQYPVAYVTVHPGDGAIIQTIDIEYNVGKLVCPLVTGPLEVVNSDTFFSQMNASFNLFKNELDSDFQTWFDGIKELIDDLELGNINLVNSVDNVTIEWISKKLRVKDRGITRNKLSFDLQSIIGVLDPSGWSYQDYYDYVSSLDDNGEEETFINQYLSSSVVNGWTATQISNFYDILKSDISKNKLWDGVNWNPLSLQDFYNLVVKFGSSKYSSMIGKTIHLQMGTYGAHDFVVIGVNKDTLVSGGKALLTFQSVDIIAKQKFIVTHTDRPGSYSSDVLHTYFENLINSFDSDVQLMIKSVYKKEHAFDSVGNESYPNFSAKIWPISTTESYGQGSDLEGSKYDYYSGGAVNGPENLARRIKKYDGQASSWVTRSYVSQTGYSLEIYFAFNTEGKCGSGDYDYYNRFIEDSPTNNYSFGNVAGIVPCFCV